MGGDTSSAPTGGNSWDSFTTKFNQHDLKGLKGMLDGADVQHVRDVAGHWQALHDDLVGPGDGGAGIQKRFDDAVKKVLESWHGDTAEKFAKRAQEISQNFTSGAPYASHTAQVMGQTAQDLQTAIDKVKPVDDGWNWGDDVWGDMPWSDQIDDKDLDKALKQDGVSTQGILDANKDNLSGHQKHRLQAAVAMENLGTAYVVRASSLKPPTPGTGRYDEKVPEHQDPTNGMGTMPMPMPGMGGPGGGGLGGGGGGGLKIPTRGMQSTPTPKTPEMPKMPNEHGINGGMGSMKPKIPDVHTGLDGLQGGGGGGAGVKMPGLGGGGGGGGASVHMPSGGGAGGGGLSGVPGMPGGGMTGRGAGGVKTGPGGAGGVKTGPGGAGAKPGTGRAGMPGMGGAHGGGAGKGAGVKGGGAGGAQARQKGGVIGKSGGKASGGAQGGSGLHRSRGGTAAGSKASGGRRPAGMMGGAHGAHGGKGEGKGQDGSRPDYLVEDEETWTPERNVAPRVIE
ncbi:hypothetical protein GCM10010211_79290 [Streptomyces albospinus]|uniref:WXG100 family type VII secretion target n=1 Tax=Streptomyces albospinus TaxID=285515 RepID=A0ABQ2VN38_9ACTN|nr:hypothetical protein [Streptomyces albospinus]GGV00065.1 hypothetical protein GCM10010211_79290 [Streptomyces albospinus]